MYGKRLNKLTENKTYWVLNQKFTLDPSQNQEGNYHLLESELKCSSSALVIFYQTTKYHSRKASNLLIHCYDTISQINILPSGHVERHDRYPMQHWWVTSLYIFLHDMHMRLSAGLAHLLLQGYMTAWCRMFGSQVTNKQTDPEPLFLEP
jgi:hypothetical protein